MIPFSTRWQNAEFSSLGRASAPQTVCTVLKEQETYKDVFFITSVRGRVEEWQTSTCLLLFERAVPLQ
jgi:hypothetical protein